MFFIKQYFISNLFHVLTGSWVNCNDSRMILSHVEELLAAQSYILFYQAVSVPSLSKPSSLTSEGSSDTLIYSLKSEDTVLFPEISDQKLKNTRAVSSSQKRLSSLSSPPSLQESDTMPILSRVSSSASTSSKSSGSKYSLKADGTQVLLGEDSVDSDTLLESSIEVVDGEISFNFKNSQETSKQSSSNTSKRTLRLSQDDSVVSSAKKPRKLSFGTGKFYPSPSSETLSSAEKSCVSPVKLSNERQQRRSKGSGVKSPNLNPADVEKLNKMVEKRSRQKGDTPKHVKRRKSTFW